MADDDLGLVPDQGQSPQPAAKPQDDDLGLVPISQPAQAKGIPIESDQSDLGLVPEEETSTTGAVAEGALRGLAGPVAPIVENSLSALGVPNLSPEEQRLRQAQHPLAAGAAEFGTLLGGSLIPGLGEYTLGAKAAELASAASEVKSFGPIATGVIKGAIEAGLLQASDEASKAVMGDPEAGVSAALTHGAFALLGGGLLGGALGKLGNKLEDVASSKQSNWLAQFGEDAGHTFNILDQKGDIASAATDEAKNLLNAVNMASEGGFSLKRSSMQQLLSDADPEKVSYFVSKTLQDLGDAPAAVKGNSSFIDAFDELKNKVTPVTDVLGNKINSPSPEDVYSAVNSFKQKIQSAAKYGYMANAETAPLYDGLRSIAKGIKLSLEDPETWGEMGKFQKELNSKYSPLQSLKKDFLSTFGGKKENAQVIDDDKVASLFRQVGRDKGALKASKIYDFLDPAKEYLATVDKLFNSRGLQSDIPKVSTDVLGTYMGEKPSPGTGMMHWLFNTGPKAIGHAAATAAGTAGGSLLGGVYPYAGYRLAEQATPFFTKILTKPTRAAIAGTLKVLASGSYEGFPKVINYTNRISKGINAINSGVNSLFIKGGQQYLNSDFSEKDREKLNDYVSSGVQNQQMKNQSTQKHVQKFAEGGEVLAQKPTTPVNTPVGGVTDGLGHVSTVFPEHGAMLGAAKVRINNYLNQIRPQDMKQKLPFDDHIKDKAHERDYNKALDLANKPLSVLDHIKNGTLEPQHVQHMNAMYPELTNHLQKKITEKIGEAQMKNEKPPYKVRQGLSLFMGSALDSNLTPQNLQAAQAVFQAQKMQQSPPGAEKPKKGTATLGKASGQYQTSEQAAQSRQLEKA